MFMLRLLFHKDTNSLKTSTHQPCDFLKTILPILLIWIQSFWQQTRMSFVTEIFKSLRGRRRIFFCPLNLFPLKNVIFYDNFMGILTMIQTIGANIYF